MNSVNVLILNVLNVHQKQPGWSRSLGEGRSSRHSSAPSIEDVDIIEVLPKDALKEVGDPQPVIDARTYFSGPEMSTYNRRGGLTSTSEITGLRINLVV